MVAVAVLAPAVEEEDLGERPCPCAAGWARAPPPWAIATTTPRSPLRARNQQRAAAPRQAPPARVTRPPRAAQAGAVPLPAQAAMGISARGGAADGVARLELSSGAADTVLRLELSDTAGRRMGTTRWWSLICWWGQGEETRRDAAGKKLGASGRDGQRREVAGWSQSKRQSTITLRPTNEASCAVSSIALAPLYGPRLPPGAGGAASPPRQVFVGGRHLGGAEKVRRLHESGELRHVIAPAPASATLTCSRCGGERYVLCGS
ncbi:hypothetical protein EJB05_15966, partial [Eragrostis curvula]